MASPIHYHYNQFPPKKINWDLLIPLIGSANAALARYDGLLQAIPDANVLLTPLSTQEAVLSSRIEGTITTMGEVLEYEAEGDSQSTKSERRDDIFEVLNYRHAMRNAVELLEKLPLCQRIILESHKILLAGVRGHGKAPGKYRKTPNWIGPPGCDVETARFVPISVDKLQNSLDIWEKYIHLDFPDKLVQLAILHAEFEALHPFLDGNGRLGRMFVPLYLYHARLIHKPMFYISAFFERNRDEYYEKLLAISANNDWSGWCKFFLKAVIEQAQENKDKAGAILSLYEAKKTQVVDLTHSQYAIHAIDFIFTRPIFKSTDFTNCKQIPSATSKRILSVLRDNDWLKVLRPSSGRRAATYAFPELLNIAEGQEVF